MLAMSQGQTGDRHVSIRNVNAINRHQRSEGAWHLARRGVGDASQRGCLAPSAAGFVMLAMSQGRTGDRHVSNRVANAIKR
jgi:hypothetical protein